MTILVENRTDQKDHSPTPPLRQVFTDGYISCFRIHPRAGGRREWDLAAGVKAIRLLAPSDSFQSAQQQRLASGKVVSHILTHPQANILNFTGFTVIWPDCKYLLSCIPPGLDEALQAQCKGRDKSKAGSLPHYNGREDSDAGMASTEGHFKANVDLHGAFVNPLHVSVSMDLPAHIKPGFVSEQPKLLRTKWKQLNSRNTSNVYNKELLPLIHQGLRK